MKNITKEILITISEVLIIMIELSAGLFVICSCLAVWAVLYGLAAKSGTPLPSSLDVMIKIGSHSSMIYLVIHFFKKLMRYM